MRDFNTYRSRPAPVLHRCSKLLLAILIPFGLTTTTRALDGKRAVSQYLHQGWGSGQGLTTTPVNTIAQTPDGYLWIGSSKGLLRFDGQTFLPLQPRQPEMPPINQVLSLAVDAGGGLWMWLQNNGILRYQDGHLEDVISRLPGESGVTAIARTRDGGIMLSTLINGIVKFSGSNFSTLAPSRTSVVISLAETTDGRIWVGTREAGLYYLDSQHQYHAIQGLPDTKINCLLPGADGKLWIGTDNGLALWDGNEVTSHNVPAALGHIQIFAILNDRDSNLWIGSAHGLLRYNSDGVSSLNKGSQQPSTPVTSLLEDREGNIWFSDSVGVQCLHDGAFATYTTAEGLPSDDNGPIFVDSHSRVWFSPLSGGLYWFLNGHVHRITNAGLGSDIVYSITGSGDDVWVGRQRGGLTHLRTGNGTVTSSVYTHSEGLAQNSVYSVYQDRDASIWAGTLTAGVSHLTHGRFINYTTRDGLASNSVSAFEQGHDGTMWFATAGGLSSLLHNQWHGYHSQDGLPSDDVICLLQGAHEVLWIGTAGGLAYFSEGVIHPVSASPPFLHEAILGLVEDRTEALWVATTSHLLKLKVRDLIRGDISSKDIRDYEIEDGLRSRQGVQRTRSAVLDNSGRVWFSMSHGISLLNPTLRNTPLVTVHIEGVQVDGNSADLNDQVRLSSAHHRIVFNYAGLSLAEPDRVLFRYRLDGFDEDWSEPVSTRQAIYTNLDPGSYRFRVIASNRDGLWNGDEGTLPFRIEPALWQTAGFQATCALVLGCLVFFAYRIRMRQLIKKADLRFEERLAERTRIAQELHDTLLQGFLSASMQLHVAVEQVPADSPAKPSLDRILQLMGEVILEGRNALRGLRPTNRSSPSLEQAFTATLQEMTDPDKMTYRVVVEGSPLPVHPVIRDEVYRIGREALLNAFRHSHAKSIEVEIEYDARQLRVKVCDDGCGVEQSVLDRGREGHWGLTGMRERADSVGAKLRLLSSSNAGTEVDLTVPGHIAYEAFAKNGFATWLTNLLSFRFKEK
ncbi:MAG TPA: two-component regulator propeller domain-containing protein [Acidobacteriaceae bacterium]